MNVTNKFTKLLGTATLVLVLSMLDVSMKPKSALQTSNDFTNFVSRLSFINEAMAGTDILTANSGTLPHHIRFMYFLINGAGANGYPPNMGGPEGGFLGMIREITGPDALGGGLATSGYSTCASVPATGSATMTDTDGTFTMYFETPVKTIPTGYTGAGSTFDKRIVVQFNGTTFMNIEFNCDTTVGWMRMAMGDTGMVSGTLRQIEVYWDTQTNSDAKLELYMTNEPGVGVEPSGNEYFVAKFQTLSSSTYKFWVIRAQNKTGDVNGFRAAAYGDTSSKNINAFFMHESTALTDTTTNHTDNSDILAASGGDIQCIDYTDPTTPVAGSGCASLTLDANAGSPISNGGAGFSINWTGDAVSGLKNDMTTLAAPTNP